MTHVQTIFRYQIILRGRMGIRELAFIQVVNDDTSYHRSSVGISDI